MKYIVIKLFCLAVVLGCENEKIHKQTVNNDYQLNLKNHSWRIENFDCQSIFKKGDFSSICFIDSKLPTFTISDCNYSLKLKENKHQQEIKIKFIEKKSGLLAEVHLALFKQNNSKGSITNNSKVGDEAFFDVYKTGVNTFSKNNKNLHVKHKNIFFSIMTNYQSNSKEPCFYDDKELNNLAKKIIDNL